MLALPAAVGCWHGAPPPITLDTTGVAPKVDYADLAAVLEAALDKHAFVLPEELDKTVKRLDAQLRLLAVTGPTATPKLLPTPEDRLAYWYNARAAWALKLAVGLDGPDPLPRARLETRPFLLDGRTMSLDAIDRVLADDDDWRTAVAAPGLRKGRARLPAKPFTPGDIRKEIRRRFNEYADDGERFEIDVERRQIRIHVVLWRIREQLIARHNRLYRTEGATLTTALLPYVQGSARRRLQDAIGYACVPRKSDGPLACKDRQ